MPRIHTSAFSGMQPKRADNLLPESFATVAENCKLTDGTLRAYKQPGTVHTLPQAASALYLYRDNGNQYWFGFNRDVDIVPSPIADDANNRVYITGHTKGARWTDNVLALAGGTSYPVNTRQLGIPEPQAPTILVEGAADDEGESGFNAETRFYVTTWVTEDGKEGPPSQPSGSAEWNNGQTVRIEADNSPGSVDLNITHFRVYVTRGDGYWWLCDRLRHGTNTIATDIPVGTAPVYDATPTEDRREQLATINWSAPPSDLQGIRLLPGGIAAGFRGKELHFSEPYVLYAWPPQYRQTLEYDIVSLEIAGNSVIVTTTGNPYLCFGTDPLSMTLQRLDVSHACLSKRSMVDMGYQALYASPDGLVAVSGGNAALITADVINPEDWRERYHPEAIQAFYHDGKYFGFYGDSPNGGNGGFLFDPQTKALTDLSLSPDCGYADLQSDTLYLCNGADITSWDKGDDLLDYRWRSRKYKGRPIKLNSARIQAESYDNLTFRLFRDDVQVMEIPVTSDKSFRLPAGRGATWQYELTGTDTVYNVTLASSMMEL